MKKLAALAVIGACLIAWPASPVGQQPASDGPEYNAQNELIRPADYREWIFVSSGLGMTYGSAQQASGRPPNFDNVFVNRESYRRFITSGKWPDKSIFILEIRRGEEHVSINNGGQTQGAVVAIEAAVKDRARFPETTWGYFDFGRDGSDFARAAAPLPTSARCYACHKERTAVEQTFVQFYPTLFEVARRFGTVNATYDPARKP